MQDSGRAHRFCDHAVAGVNWRPTRFVDEVPTSRVCGLCHMIPNRILVLPCGHLLCQSCHTAISQGVGGRCPLDEEPFDQAECGSYDLPTRTASAMKVYCWNEAHGCQFEGTMEDMLRHYEKECTFQTGECLRCGEVVLHRELSTHYVAGCTTPVCSARNQNTSSESTAPTLQDVIASLEEVKTLLRDSGNGERPPATENTMNELADESGNHESTSIVAPRGVGSSSENRNSGMTEVEGTTPSKLLQEPTSQRNPSEEISAALPWYTEESTSLPNFFRNLPAEVMADMRKISSRDYPQCAFTGREPMNFKFCLNLTEWPLTTECTWGRLRGDVEYQLAIEDILDVMSGNGESTPRFKLTVLHTRDAYFNIEVFGNGSFLALQVEFYGMLEGSQCSAPSLNVHLYGVDEIWRTALECIEDFDCCKPDEDSFLHFRRTFRVEWSELRSNDCFRKSRLRLRFFHPGAARARECPNLRV